jgi:hypothetical protein
MQQAFIIRAFNTKKDSAGREVDFERIAIDAGAGAVDFPAAKVRRWIKYLRSV